MADRRTHVIVGAGMTGAKAAQTLREEGFDGRVLLVGAEPELPYERPPLSKDYLRGETPREKAQVHSAAFYGEQDVELLTGTTAVTLDVGARRIGLADGRELGYDRLLLATGAVARRPPIPGVDLPGVLVLRTLADADTIRAALAGGGPLVVVGGGWIGCEVAASARQGGADVTLVELGGAPLERVLGPDLGGWFGALHRARGVNLVVGRGVARLEGDGRVERVVLDDGRAHEAAVVVLGVGVVPDTRLAEMAGLAVGDGVTVDERLRTSAPGVFAAGDVAAAFHPRYGRHVRVEHWSTALHQGVAAGRSMLDRDEPYDRLPYFFSDQYDAGMEYIGLHAPEDRVVVRGSLEDERLRAFWLDGDDRVTGAMHINHWGAIDPLTRLVESGRSVDPRVLADLDQPVAAWR